MKAFPWLAFALLAGRFAWAQTSPAAELGREREARPRYLRYLELWPSTPRRSEIELLIGDVSRY